MDDIVGIKLTDEQKALITEYGHLFNNTGGNDVVELIERRDATMKNNWVVALLQACCTSQLILLQRLRHDGLLLRHCAAHELKGAGEEPNAEY